jgi:hypothetical protein
MTNLLIEVKSHTGRPIPQAGAVVKFVHGHNYRNDLKQRTRADRERAGDQSPRAGGRSGKRQWRWRERYREGGSG